MLTREEVENFDLSDVKKIHSIGIMNFSAFNAKRILHLGIELTASEYVQDDPRREYWEEIGVLYPGGHNEMYVTEDIDLIIYPNGPIPGNPECEKAEKLGIPAMTVGQMTGVLTRDLKSIAVAGTHGKTTTTALIIWMMKQLGQEPNFVVGDKISGFDHNWGFNADSEYFVVEACEYKSQFLDRAPSPWLSVITHIGLDHTDVFKDQQEYNQAFVEFLNNTQKAIIIDASGENEKNVVKNLELDFNEIDLIDVATNRNKEEKFETKLIGNYNQENILRTFLTGKYLGYKEEDIRKSMKSFPGIKARFEFLGKTPKGSPIYNDYAHNPDKVEACISGAREAFPNKKIIFVFQPHTHERSHTFRNEFAESIAGADVVIVSNIYTHRRESEELKELISAEEFTKILADNNKDKEVVLAGDFAKTVKAIWKYDDGDSIVILATAGDLPKIIPQIKYE